MFQVFENAYTPGEKTPTQRVVATRAKEGSAQAIADKLNRKQDHVKPEEGMRIYWVRAQGT